MLVVHATPNLTNKFYSGQEFDPNCQK